MWSVPVLLIVGIGVVVTVLTSGFGWIGLLAALFLVAWLQRKADAYVRARDARRP